MADVVTSTFTANTSQLESALKTILEQQSALEANTVKTGAALDGFSASGDRAAAGAKVASEATAGLNVSLERLAPIATMSSEALERMGVDAGGAAKGLNFLTESAAGLEAVAAPLLVIAAALVAVGAAFSFLREGVSEAADLQSQMQTLGAVVASQGDDWATAQEGLDKFVESESLATGFTAGQLVPALNQLVTAGNDVHDSQQIMTVATELARAKHMELGQAVDLIIGMEAGRSRGLVAQDLNLKKLVGTNATLSDWLGVLHKDYGGAITDSNSLEMQHARLDAVWKQVSETLGKLFLPLLTDFCVQMIGAIENAKDLGSGLYQMFAGAVAAAKAAGAGIAHFAHALADMASHDYSGAVDECKVGESGMAAWDGIKTSAQGAAKAINEVVNGQDAGVRGHKIVNEALYKHNQQAGHLNLDNNRIVKEKKPAKTKAPKSAKVGSTSTFSTQDVDNYIEKLTAAKDAQTLLTENLRDMDASLDSDRAAVSSATTVHELATAKLKLESDTRVELANKSILLARNVDAEKAAVVSLAAAHQDAIEHQHNLAEAIHQYNLILAASNGGTIEQQNTLAELKQAEKDAQKEITATGAAVAENTRNLNTNTAALDANNDKKIAEQKNALAEVQLKYDEYLTKEKQKDDEAKATLGMNTAQLYSFYAQKYQQDFALWKSYVDAKDTYMAGVVLPQLEADQTRANQEQVKLYDENAKAHKAMLDKMTSNVTSFLDDVIVKHKSFKDILTGIYDQILQAFISMVAKMIVESALFGKIFGNLGGGGAGGGGLLAGLFGAATGGGGANGKAEVVLSDVGPNAAKVLTGSTNGVSSLFVNAAGAATPMGIFTVLAGAAGLGGLVGGAVGGPGAPNAKENGGIGAMLGVGGVMAYAAMAPGLLGGAAGLSGIGALLTGPAGIGLLLGGALLGGALGGMIGPHWGPASNYPDRGPDAAAYQNFLSTFNSGPGGGGDQLEKLVASEDPSKLTGQALADYQQLKALEGGTGQLGISNEHDGMFTLHAGTTDKVDDFEALVARFNAETAPGAGATATNPIYALSRMGPDFNTARMSQWQPSMASLVDQTANGGNGPQVTPPPINITVNGVVGDKSQVAAFMNEEIQRNYYYRRGNQQLLQ